jgi:hypothetical protein
MVAICPVCPKLRTYCGIAIHGTHFEIFSRENEGDFSRARSPKRGWGGVPGGLDTWSRAGRSWNAHGASASAASRRWPVSSQPAHLRIMRVDEPVSCDPVVKIARQGARVSLASVPIEREGAKGALESARPARLSTTRGAHDSSHRWRLYEPHVVLMSPVA